MIRSESIPPCRGEPQASEKPGQPGPLTAAQRNFAQVVGQALADAWHRHLQHTNRDSPSEGSR